MTALTTRYGRGESLLGTSYSATDTLLNSATTEQNFATTITIPANTFTTNRLIRITAHYYGTVTTITQIYRLKLGSTVLYTSGTITPTAASNFSGTMQWVLQGTGSPGAAVGVACSTSPGSLMSAGVGSRNITAQPVNVATNAAQAITLSVQFGATGSTDTIGLMQLFVEVLN